MPHDIQTMLAEPFEDSDIEWRLQWTDEEKSIGLAVPYVTNRAIQARLDKAVGVNGWKNEYIPWHSDGKKASQLCGLSIYSADRKEWITKYDGAENSDMEAIKGGLSDSMKRAAVQWGIGRYLYEMDSVFVDTEKRGKTLYIKKSAQPKLDAEHQKTVRAVFGTAQPDTTASAPVARDPKLEAKPPVSQQPSSKPEPAPVIQHPSSAASPAMPENRYLILNAAIKPSMNGDYTLAQLQGADGSITIVCIQGTNHAITPNRWLENVVITQQESGGVVFNTVDSFNFAAEQAA